MNTLSITVPVMVFGLFLYLRLYKRMNLENEALRTELAETRHALRMEILPVAQEALVLQTKFDRLRGMLDHVFRWIKDHDAEPLDPALAVEWAREARKRQREIEEALGG